MIHPPDIASKLEAVKARIAQACKTYQRDPATVNLLAVSKTKPAALVTAALSSGQTDFGENYLQDALSKIDTLRAEAPSIEPVWHFIGAIQSNKTRPIAERFTWVHTVASIKVARRLNDQRPDDKAALKIFLQVNVDEDPNKSGFSPADLEAAVSVISDLPNVSLQGLMTIPKERHGLEAQRTPFRALRLLQEKHCPAHQGLSMGMSGDLEAAIAEGATWVRIGTDIFGARETL